MMCPIPRSEIRPGIALARRARISAVFGPPAHPAPGRTPRRRCPGRPRRRRAKAKGGPTPGQFFADHRTDRLAGPSKRLRTSTLPYIEMDGRARGSGRSSSSRSAPARRRPGHEPRRRLLGPRAVPLDPKLKGGADDRLRPRTPLRIRRPGGPGLRGSRPRHRSVARADRGRRGRARRRRALTPAREDAGPQRTGKDEHLLAGDARQGR